MHSIKSKILSLHYVNEKKISDTNSVKKKAILSYKMYQNKIIYYYNTRNVRWVSVLHLDSLNRRFKEYKHIDYMPAE